MGGAMQRLAMHVSASMIGVVPIAAFHCAMTHWISVTLPMVHVFPARCKHLPVSVTPITLEQSAKRFYLLENAQRVSMGEHVRCPIRRARARHNFMGPHVSFSTV